LLRQSSAPRPPGHYQPTHVTFAERYLLRMAPRRKKDESNDGDAHEGRPLTPGGVELSEVGGAGGVGGGGGDGGTASSLNEMSPFAASAGPTPAQQPSAPPVLPGTRVGDELGGHTSPTPSASRNTGVARAVLNALSPLGACSTEKPRTKSSPDGLQGTVVGEEGGEGGVESTESSIRPLECRESVMPLQRAATMALNTTQKTLQLSGEVRTPSFATDLLRSLSRSHARAFNHTPDVKCLNLETLPPHQ
jgi:hypothetical protein